MHSVLWRVSLPTRLRGKILLMNDDPARLRKENAQLRRQIEELRALLPTLRTEATALREENAWQKRWLKELREAVAILTGPGVTVAPSPPQTGANVLEPDAAA
jgi:hypothetical protein